MKLEEILKKLPRLNCGECGYSCVEMARRIAEGKAKFEDCVILAAGKKLVLEVDGKAIPVGKFVQDIIRRANIGILKAIIDVNSGDCINIKINLENNEVEVRLNDKRILLDEKTIKILRNAVLGMISTLKMVWLGDKSKIFIEINVDENDLKIPYAGFE